MIYSDILKGVQTLSKVYELCFEIDMLIASLYKREPFQDALKSVRALTSQDLAAALLQNGIDLGDKVKIKNFLTELRGKVSNLKPFKIYLALEPSKTMINNIFSWILSNLGFGYVLDIEVDEKLVGGAVIAFSGKYKDFSLRKSIEEAFANKKEEIRKTVA